MPSDGAPRPYVWADITWLLHTTGRARRTTSARTVASGPRAAADGGEHQPHHEPLPGFETVQVTKQFKEHPTGHRVLRAAANGTLPSVSSVVPTLGVSEHPPDSIALRQESVTSVVNAVMQGPADQWLHTAIFITWDDWGGFYDHVEPIRIDENGTASACRDLDQPVRPSRVHRQPDALVRRVPQARRGSVPWRPAPRPADGRVADSRPTVREAAPQLGDLSQEFDLRSRRYRHSSSTRPPDGSARCV